MEVFSLGANHEQVVYCNDPSTGLRAIIAIYSTALGPALGGTRFYPYATEDDALADVLNLSRAMAYKAACAGLDLGGGKAVIIGDPATDKSEALLRSYGRFVQAVGGRYYTACDVGTYVEDMDVVARECSFVTGRSPAYGGAGDSSILTAYGVFQGMRAAADVAWGSSSLRGKRVGIAGVGKEGPRRIGHDRADRPQRRDMRRRQRNPRHFVEVAPDRFHGLLSVKGSAYSRAGGAIATRHDRRRTYTFRSVTRP